MKKTIKKISNREKIDFVKGIEKLNNEEVDFLNYYLSDMMSWKELGPEIFCSERFVVAKSKKEFNVLAKQFCCGYSYVPLLMGDKKLHFGFNIL